MTFDAKCYALGESFIEDWEKDNDCRVGAADRRKMAERIQSAIENFLEELPAAPEEPKPQQEGHGVPYYAWREQQRKDHMAERCED